MPCANRESLDFGYNFTAKGRGDKVAAIAGHHHALVISP
jgi:hypothetical protein